MCTDAEILRRLCQLTLTRITHQGSHMIDLNVKKKNRRGETSVSLHIRKKKDKMNSMRASVSLMQNVRHAKRDIFFYAFLQYRNFLRRQVLQRTRKWKNYILGYPVFY